MHVATVSMGCLIISPAVSGIRRVFLVCGRATYLSSSPGHCLYVIVTFSSLYSGYINSISLFLDCSLICCVQVGPSGPVKCTSHKRNSKAMYKKSHNTYTKIGQKIRTKTNTKAKTQLCPLYEKKIYLVVEHSQQKLGSDGMFHVKPVQSMQLFFFVLQKQHVSDSVFFGQQCDQVIYCLPNCTDEKQKRNHVVLLCGEVKVLQFIILKLKIIDKGCDIT